MMAHGYANRAINDKYPMYTLSQLTEIKNEYPLLKELNALSRIRRNILTEYNIIKQLPHSIIYLRDKNEESFNVLDEIEYQGDKGVFTKEELNQESDFLDHTTVYNRLVTVTTLKITEATGVVLPEGLDYTHLFNLTILTHETLQKYAMTYGRIRTHYGASFIFCESLLPYKENDERTTLGVYDDSKIFHVFLVNNFKVKGIKEAVVLQPEGLGYLQGTGEPVIEVTKKETAGILYVDCDNTPYYGFLNLVSKIKEENNLTEDNKLTVKLFIDPYSSNSWEYTVDLPFLEIETVHAPRLLENKSVVDLLLVAHFFEDREKTAHRYVISSDSDFFVLHSLGYNFTVVYSKEAVSSEYTKYMENENIKHIAIENLKPSEEILGQYIRTLLIQEVLQLLTKTAMVEWGTTLKENLLAVVKLDRVTEAQSYDMSKIRKELTQVYAEVTTGVEMKRTEQGLCLTYQNYSYNLQE